jgi:L-glutamine-phosphate cytidylyltransferase
MVLYQGRPLIEHIAGALRDGGISDIVAVRGYAPEALRCEGVRFYDNPDYRTTNMVHSLFCAERELRGDVIISSSDIVYSASVVRRLLDSPASLAVVVDRNGRRLWQERMDDPLEDAETLRLDERGNIVELGKRASSPAEIEGQYIGLMKVSASAWPELHAFYAALDRDADYAGKTFQNMSMKSFIQAIIARLMPVRAVLIEEGWLAIDVPSDLEIAVNLSA